MELDVLHLPNLWHATYQDQVKENYSPVAGDDVVPPEVHAAIEHNTNRNATHPEHRDVGPQDPLACELLQHVKGRVDLVLVTVRVRDDGDTGPWSAGYRFQVEP